MLLCSGEDSSSIGANGNVNSISFHYNCVYSEEPVHLKSIQAGVINDENHDDEVLRQDRGDKAECNLFEERTEGTKHSSLWVASSSSSRAFLSSSVYIHG